MNRPVIGFAGMTHLGIVSAAAAAELGFEVVCFDTHASRLEPLKQHRLAIVEPGLPELLIKNQSRLTFTDRPDDMRHCAVVYVAIDVPTGESGQADSTAVHELIRHLRDVIHGRIIVMLSQVQPGFTRRLGMNPDRCFYQAETLIFGRAVDRAVHPERIILGCANPSQSLPPALEEFLKAFHCPILPLHYESAELSKIAINLFLAASVSTTNTLAELCEHLGADWSEIVTALRMDRRIGPHAYLTPGLGIAGGNLERDLAAAVQLAQDFGCDAAVIESFSRNSRYRRDWALRTIHAQVPFGNNTAIGILGLAYKENTHSTKNSASLNLIQHLQPWGLRVYDPVVPATVVDHPHVIGCSSALQVARGVEALVVMTPWPAFRELQSGDLARFMAGRTIIDPYRVLDGRALVSAGFDYFAVGARPMSAQQVSCA